MASVLTQTYVNWECIVVDDGSTDLTIDVVQKYCNKDARFKLYNRPHNRQKGGNAARNYGFEQSLGEFVNWFDSDDLMKKNHITHDFRKCEGVIPFIFLKRLIKLDTF